MTRNHRNRHHAGANDDGRSDLPALAIDALPGIWSTWMQFPALRAGDLPSAGAKQATEDLAHDPLLKSIEQMWNANPLHDVIPLDWAGIAWALRTVWLRSLTRPTCCWLSRSSTQPSGGPLWISGARRGDAGADR